MRFIHYFFHDKILPAKALSTMEQTVSLTTGHLSSDYSENAYGLGMFRMNTPAGLIRFTPGLTPGYRSLWVYMPCYDISFAYSVSNALIDKSLHLTMMEQIIPTILADKGVQKSIKKYQKKASLPDYCHTVTPANEWRFINF